MMSEVFGIITGLFALGGLVMSKANQRVDTVTRRARRLKFGVYVLIVYAMLGSALTGYFAWLVGLIILLGLTELIRVSLSGRLTKLRSAVLFWSLLIYLALAYGVLSFAQTSTPATIIFVYVIVAAFDGFSQATGQLLGKHRLTPRISRGKTVEGAFGGLLAAVSVALLLRALPQATVGEAAFLGTLVSTAGLSGDLLASWYKRRHGVKDFGHLLPEHGGVLDRFDSLFAAGTVFWMYATLIR